MWLGLDSGARPVNPACYSGRLSRLVTLVWITLSRASRQAALLTASDGHGRLGQPGFSQRPPRCLQRPGVGHGGYVQPGALVQRVQSDVRGDAQQLRRRRRAGVARRASQHQWQRADCPRVAVQAGAQVVVEPPACRSAGPASRAVGGGCGRTFERHARRRSTGRCRTQKRRRKRQVPCAGGPRAGKIGRLEFLSSACRLRVNTYSEDAIRRDIWAPAVEFLVPRASVPQGLTDDK